MLVIFGSQEGSNRYIILPSYDTSSFHWPNEIWTELRGLSYTAETEETKGKLHTSSVSYFRTKLDGAWGLVGVYLLFGVCSHGSGQKPQTLFLGSQPHLLPQTQCTVLFFFCFVFSPNPTSCPCVSTLILKLLGTNTSITSFRCILQFSIICLSVWIWKSHSIVAWPFFTT